jgi:hypothetical protein
LLEEFFERTIREMIESERALRSLAAQAGQAAAQVLFRADQLAEARDSLEQARAHLRLAGDAGRTSFKGLVDEFEFVQEYLWDAYRHFLHAMMGPTN